MNGLALQVQETLRRDPFGGHVFVFRGKRGDLIKILWHDGQGICLFSKRLEHGRFIWPSTTCRWSIRSPKGTRPEGRGGPADGVVTISAGQLGYLLEGIDWRMPRRTIDRLPTVDPIPKGPGPEAPAGRPQLAG